MNIEPKKAARQPTAYVVVNLTSREAREFEAIVNDLTGDDSNYWSLSSQQRSLLEQFRTAFSIAISRAGTLERSADGVKP